MIKRLGKTSLFYVIIDVGDENGNSYNKTWSN